MYKEEEKNRSIEALGQKVGFGFALLIFISILNYIVGKLAYRYISYKFLIPGVIVIYLLSLIVWRKE